MEERSPKRPWRQREQWAFALAAWLAGVYPLGYGPAFGYYWRTGDPRVGTAFDATYGPMETLRYDGPQLVSAAVGWYLDLWMPEGWNEPIGCCFGPPLDAVPGGQNEDASAEGPE